MMEPFFITLDGEAVLLKAVQGIPYLYPGDSECRKRKMEDAQKRGGFRVEKMHKAMRIVIELGCTNRRDAVSHFGQVAAQDVQSNSDVTRMACPLTEKDAENAQIWSAIKAVQQGK